ncbi:MAG: hypothetical protein NTV81_00085 [Candidatus Komeilibacteria bacterium]|nr:hypothetical protein [Candidatus Komeilibacteria bacterium]
MKVYFFTNEYDETTKQIAASLRSSGILILSNQEHFSSISHPADMSLEKMQAVIIYGAEAASAGYLVAAALSQKKPVLYVLPKGNLFPEELKFLQGNRQLAQLFLVKFVQPGKATEAIYDFLELLETGELRQENVSIKFTFRLSPRLERYLNWRSVKEKISKADWLRNFLIEEVIEKDEAWKNYIKNKNKPDQEGNS